MKKSGHTLSHHNLTILKDQENIELRAQVAAYTEELELLTHQLDATLAERDFLSDRVQRIQYDLEEERNEFASREHDLLRQNTPGGQLQHPRSRISFHLPSDDDDETVIGPRSCSAVGYGYQQSSALETALYRRSRSHHDIDSIRYHTEANRDEEEEDEEVEPQSEESAGEGFFDDELLPTSYYVEPSGPGQWDEEGECEGCLELDSRLQEAEVQMSFLDGKLDDKDRYIESIEYELDEAKAALRSLKLDKDITEYELVQQNKLATEKLASTEQCLAQKDRAYMDLLERFVQLERSYQETDDQLRQRSRESATLSEKLSSVEFDLMIAEEQLQKQANEHHLLSFSSISSSTTSSPGQSPGVGAKSYNLPTIDRGSSLTLSRLERCSLDQQPLSIPRSSGSSVEVWESDQSEEEQLECIRRTKLEAEKHAKIQDMLTAQKRVSAYELFKITQELAGMNGGESKENDDHSVSSGNV